MNREDVAVATMAMPETTVPDLPTTLSRDEKLCMVGYSTKALRSEKWIELTRRNPKRVPRYLREDFPKVSMGGSVVLRAQGVPGAAKTRRRRKRPRAKKGKNSKKHKGTAVASFVPTKIPTPPELDKLLRQKMLVRANPSRNASSAPSEGLQNLLQVPRPPRIPKPKLPGPRDGGVGFLKERGLTADRVNERLMLLQPANAAASFLDKVENQEAESRRLQQAARAAMRAKGQDRILVNTKRVTCASEEYLASEAKRRETFMKDLRASLERAKERKLLLEDARTERVTALVYRQKTEAERAALHEAKQQAGRKVLVMLVHALSGARVQALAQSLDYRQRLRNAAVRIQQSVRMWGAARHLQDCLAAKARIVRFFRTVVTFRRKRKEYWYAQAMLQFLVDNRMNFGQIMRDFRYRVIKCQRFARMFLACTQARVVALARVWTQQERRLAAKARSLKLQLLEKQSRRLRQEAESMRNSPRGAEYAAAKYLRQIEIPESLRACMLDPNSLASSESVASAPGTGAGTGVGAGTSVNDGALRFPVGLGLRSGREASSARVQAQYREQVSQSANYILDVFLNEEFQARLEQEKKRPLRLRPVPRRERYEILRDVISRARAAHQARMVKLQRERKVLETQKVKVDVSEAKKLLSEQSEVMNVTRALFSDLGRQPVLLLFSRLQEREIFRLVQSAQTRLAETRSMQQLIAQLRYE